MQKATLDLDRAMGEAMILSWPTEEKKKAQLRSLNKQPNPRIADKDIVDRIRFFGGVLLHTILLVYYQSSILSQLPSYPLIRMVEICKPPFIVDHSLLHFSNNNQFEHIRHK